MLIRTASSSHTVRIASLGAWVVVSALGCSNAPSSPSSPHVQGQSEFTSVPLGNQNNSFRSGADSAGSNVASGGSASVSVPSAQGASGTATPRTVEETDLYRLDGDRLYYLNSYRGLMVFDVSDVDHPRLLGRSPIYGTPIEMLVRNGVATVVVSDWYGTMDDGTPFHGSIVRGIDATDPTNMRVLGEAALGGDVRDTRVVGDVIYTVTQRYPSYYGWDTANVVGSSTTNNSQVTVASVSFAGGVIQKADEYVSSGQDGIFYVTADAILLGFSLTSTDQYGYPEPNGNAQLTYVDISDPAGKIAVRGSFTFQGYLQGFGTDNGRWNIDFADDRTAHVLSCDLSYCGNSGSISLTTVDFSSPDAPVLQSHASMPSNSWSPAVRFDAGRMYLSPSGYYYSGVQGGPTPIQIFDLSNPKAPALAGTAYVNGQIWDFFPAGDRLFALGNTYQTATNDYGSAVDLHYLDVSNAANPSEIGDASFGQGWAWTPAAGTFKAFTKNDANQLVVLPFSGWSSADGRYNNGLQLIEFAPGSISTSGAAMTHGWVERGIFVKNRLVSLSDLALAVVDYTNHATPVVVNELTLARNVINVRPQTNGSVAELSSDFWDNDTTHSELRVLDASNVDEAKGDATLADVQVPGINARVFHDGSMSYVLSEVSRNGACPASYSYNGTCTYWHTHVQAIDRSQSAPVLRGSLDLPESYGYYYWGWGWGWWGCFAWDWFYGAQTVQVGGHILAMQTYTTAADGTNPSLVLTTVNFADPDRPVLAQLPVVDQSTWWWGNLRAVGDQLYASHYEWVEQPSYDYVNGTSSPGSVRYYLDHIDLSNPAAPAITARINVPGVLVGASANDPNLIYTMDSRWYGDHAQNELAVLRLDGGVAYYQGGVSLPGYVGNVFVQGSRAYFSVQNYTTSATTTTSSISLYQANLDDPTQPKLLASTPQQGWGWLLDVQGDRAFVQSGWGDTGLDVYKLTSDSPPAFDQTVRARGWYTGALARQGNDVYLATGYWGTEHVTLQ